MEYLLGISKVLGDFITKHCLSRKWQALAEPGSDAAFFIGGTVVLVAFVLLIFFIAKFGGIVGE